MQTQGGIRLKQIIRVITISLALLLFTLPVIAETTLDLESMTDEELISLRDRIDEELSKREEAAIFTVEHDEEYLATRKYIAEFLQNKGYVIETSLGVPNMGLIEDNDPSDHYTGWYAYIMRNGNWVEHTVLLFDGEVVSCIPSKK
jgi:hypothetical protein